MPSRIVERRTTASSRPRRISVIEGRSPMSSASETALRELSIHSVHNAPSMIDVRRHEQKHAPSIAHGSHKDAHHSSSPTIVAESMHDGSSKGARAETRSRTYSKAQSHAPSHFTSHRHTYAKSHAPSHAHTNTHQSVQSQKRSLDTSRSTSHFVEVKEHSGSESDSTVTGMHAKSHKTRSTSHRSDRHPKTHAYAESVPESNAKPRVSKGASHASHSKYDVVDREYRRERAFVAPERAPHDSYRYIEAPRGHSRDRRSHTGRSSLT